MTGIILATDNQPHSHTPAKIRDDKHRQRLPEARRHDSSNTTPRPPTARALRKSLVHNPIETARGVPVRDYMTSEEFRAWVSDMKYPQKQGMVSVDKIPYRAEPICRDLGIQVNRFYAYWRGIEKGKVVTINPSLTRLCMCLLARRRAAWLMDDLVRAHPECGDMIRQIAASLVMPAITGGAIRRAVTLDPKLAEEVKELRESAALLRRSAHVMPNAETRNRLRRDAEELEARALEIEDKAGVVPVGPAPGSRPAERDKSQKIAKKADKTPDPDDLGDWDTEG